MEVNDVFANYTIVQFCGSGAYGEVYLAEDITHKIVALKLIPISAGTEVWKMELIGLRYYRQNIEDYRALIEILHVGETENFFYYSMEAADNMLHGDEADGYIADTLAHRLERGGRLEPDKVLELANSLLDALEHLAEHDLAHRDIKPANIVFVNGQAKLSDIGLISTTGVRSKVVGTLDFLPPEIADGDPVGYGHDLFALGKVLYCALTGLLPENYPEVPLTVPLRAWRQFKNVILRACSPDPRQRFYTPEDFRAALPSSIKPTTFIDEAYENIRTYKKQHPVSWRLSIISSVLILLALLLAGYLSYELRLEKERLKREKINFIFRTIDTLNDRQIHFRRIAERSGNPSRPLRLQVIAELASEARAAGDMDATERYCRTADSILKLWAQEELRILYEKYPAGKIPPQTEKLFSLLQKHTDFSYTPLAEYLHKNAMEQQTEYINSMREHLTRRWVGPIPGSEWQLGGDPDLKFTYIPAGGMQDEPQYAYWFGVNEVTNRTAKRLLAQAGLNLPDNDLPVTGISWNDRMDICRKLTEEAQAAGTLPPGYIYRLPYSNEWLFVVQGAWESAGNFIHEQQEIMDYAWYGANSMYTLHSVRTRQVGVPAVYDMIGNASESVLTTETISPAVPSTANFGGSFRDRRIAGNMYMHCSPDMFIKKWSGLRLVLAPGNMDYFEHNWYSGKQQSVKLGNATYELLGAASCRWVGQSALQWCKLLQCTPAVLNMREEREKLLLKTLRSNELPMLVGAIGTDRGWYWLDRSPVYDGEWFNGQQDAVQKGATNYLVIDHGFWRGVKASETVPLLLLKHHAKTPNPIDLDKVRSPLILKKFSAGKRRFVVLSAPVDWYTAKRLADMLGGKLAQISNTDDKKIFEQHLDNLPEKVLALGGIRRNGQWSCDNGKAINLDINSLEKKARSLNDAFLAIKDNKLIISDQLDGFICEY